MFRRDVIMTLSGVVAGSSLSIRHLLGIPVTPFDTNRTAGPESVSDHSDRTVNHVSEDQRLKQQLRHCQRNCQLLTHRMQLQRAAAAKVLLLDETSRLCQLAERRLCEQSEYGIQSPALWQACSDACLRAADISRRSTMASAIDLQVFEQTADCCRKMIS